MLKFTFDITTRIATPSHVQSIRRGDDEEIKVTLLDDGDAYQLKGGEKLIFALKAKSAKRNTDPLIHVLTEDWSGVANVYTAPLDTENADLLAAIDGLELGVTALQLVGDIAWYADSAEGTKPKSSQDLDVTCKNDVSRDGDGIPPASTSFWQRVKAVFSGTWFAKDDGTQIITPIIATQADAVAGSGPGLMNPQRTAQAIAALANGGVGGGGAWGSITGTLANQTDLQTALNAKANSSHTHSAATTSAAGFMSSADKTKLNGIESGATADMTAAEILAAIKSVDGTGSGLDADLLDGEHKTYFATASETNNLLTSLIALVTRVEALEARPTFTVVDHYMLVPDGVETGYVPLQNAPP